jgi:hypothetical protein
VSSSIVLIGPSHSLPALAERLDSSAELHTFTDAEALEALDHVMRIRPRIVALEKEFSATPRGRALISRISDDPTLRDCEIRVLVHDMTPALNRKSSRRVAPAPGGAVAVADGPGARGGGSGALDQQGTRRAPRVRVRDGVEVLVDGNPAALIDISAAGMQVVSPKMLRPNQRVRVALPHGAHTIRCDGSIAWASYEMPKGQTPRFRAGIELAGADPASVKAYAERNKRK